MGVLPRVEQSHGSQSSSERGVPDFRKSASIVEVGAWTSFAPAVVQAQLLQQLEDNSDENLAPPRTLRAAAIFADASGFTALTERLAQRADGAEQMCRIMNQFFGEVIRIVHEHGGDILKFAGDAVSVVFETATELRLRRQGLAEMGMMDPNSPRGANMAAAAAAAARTRGEEPLAPPEEVEVLSQFHGYGPAVCDDPDGEMREAVERAARCCFALHSELHNFVAWREPAAEGGGGNGGGGGSGGGNGGNGGGGSLVSGQSGVFPAAAGAKEIRLSLHIGLGCGEVSVMHLGGHHGRREFVAAGAAVSQAARAEPFATSGETCASADAWAFLNGERGGEGGAGSGACTADPVNQSLHKGAEDRGAGLWLYAAPKPSLIEPSSAQQRPGSFSLIVCGCCGGGRRGDHAPTSVAPTHPPTPDSHPPVHKPAHPLTNDAHLPALWHASRSRSQAAVDGASGGATLAQRRRAGNALPHAADCASGANAAHAPLRAERGGAAPRLWRRERLRRALGDPRGLRGLHQPEGSAAGAAGGSRACPCARRWGRPWGRPWGRRRPPPRLAVWHSGGEATGVAEGLCGGRPGLTG